MRGDSIRVVYPLFPEEGGGSIPTSPLQLNIGQISRETFILLNEYWHSSLPLARNCFEGICYGASYKNIYYSVAWWGKPIASNRLKNSETIFELRRLAIASDAPKNTASRMLKIMRLLLKKKKPFLKKLISYQDVDKHLGIIYKASGWQIASKTRFTSWKNRIDFNRIDQSISDKIRWEYNL